MISQNSKLDKKTEFRKRFIEEFTKALIFESIPKDSSMQNLHPKKQKTRMVFPEHIKRNIKVLPIRKPVEKSNPLDVLKQLSANPKPNEKQIQKTSTQDFQPSILNSPKQIENLKEIQPSETKNQNLNLKSSKLSELLKALQNPSIFSVESPGPNKPALINNSGRIQTLGFSLTKKEIQEILEEISQKTKIPLTPGVFKAAFGNYILTAVISDYVGSRFIIQKKSFSTPKMY
jgi:hypothetical protein